MDRITNPGVIPDPREFTEGGPEAGLPATPLAAKWLNDMQEEICAVIEAHAGALDPNNRNQLRDAILYWVDNANAAKVDGLPIVMTDALEGYVLSVIGVGTERQVVATPVQSTTPPEHTHAIDDVDGLQEALDGKSDTGHTHTPEETGSFPANYYTPRMDSMNNESGNILKWSGDLNTRGMGSYVAAEKAGTANYPDDEAPCLYVETRSIYNDSLLQVAWPFDGLGAVWHRNYSTETDTWTQWVKMFDMNSPPTAAQSNADVIATGGHGCSGSYGLMSVVYPHQGGPGTSFGGSNLMWASAAGSTAGSSPAGSWKLLGNTLNTDAHTATSLFIRTDTTALLEQARISGAVWSNAERTRIDVQLQLANGDILPFTASQDDIEGHGRWMFAMARGGEFGPVAAFVPLTEVEVATQTNPLRRRQEMALAISQAQHCDMMEDVDQATAWRAHYRQLYSLEALPDWPLVVQWPTAPEEVLHAS